MTGWRWLDSGGRAPVARAGCWGKARRVTCAPAPRPAWGGSPVPHSREERDYLGGAPWARAPEAPPSRPPRERSELVTAVLFQQARDHCGLHLVREGLDTCPNVPPQRGRNGPPSGFLARDPEAPRCPFGRKGHRPETLTMLVRHLDAQAEGAGLHPSRVEDLLDAAARGERRRRGAAHALSHEAQGVQQRALPRAVWADERGDRPNSRSTSAPTLPKFATWSLVIIGWPASCGDFSIVDGGRRKEVETRHGVHAPRQRRFAGDRQAPPRTSTCEARPFGARSTHVRGSVGRKSPRPYGPSGCRLGHDSGSDLPAAAGP